MSVNLISVELGTQSQQFLTTVHKKDKSDEDINNQKEMGKKTLAAIDAEIDNVSIISKNYLQELRNLIDTAIESEIWEVLPSASKVRADLQQIKSTVVAITESREFISIDIEAIMSEIIKSQGKLMELAAEMKALSRHYQVQLNASENKNKEIANQKELQGVIVSAAFNIVSGVVQFGAGCLNLKSAGKSMKDSLEAFDEAGTLTARSANNLANKSTFDGFKAEIDTKKMRISELNNDNKLSNLTHAKRETNNKEIEKLNQDIQNIRKNKSFNGGEAQLAQFAVDEKKSQSLIDKLNNTARARTERTATKTSMINSLGSLGSTVANGANAIMKFESRRYEIYAEIDRQGSAMASSAEQGDIDLYQKLRSDITALIQSTSAMLQATATSNSKLVA